MVYDTIPLGFDVPVIVIFGAEPVSVILAPAVSAVSGVVTIAAFGIVLAVMFAPLIVGAAEKVVAARFVAPATVRAPGERVPDTVRLSAVIPPVTVKPPATVEPPVTVKPLATVNPLLNLYFMVPPKIACRAFVGMICDP